MDKFSRVNRLIVFFASLMFTTLAFASSKMNVNSKDNNSQVLFVLLSKEAAIHELSSNDYQLTLKGVNPLVVYFANRPARFSSELGLDKFLQQWSAGSFKNDPPNAMIHSVRFKTNVNANNTEEAKAQSVSYAVVLTNPHYNKVNHQLSFDIKPLKGNHMPLPADGKSDYAALFIDNVCLTCLM